MTDTWEELVEQLRAEIEALKADHGSSRDLSPADCVALEEKGWLVEWPHEQGDAVGTRWWHPNTGWRFDANEAIRYARKEDAEAEIARDRFCAGVIATEHAWVAKPSSAKPTERERSRDEPNEERRRMDEILQEQLKRPRFRPDTEPNNDSSDNWTRSEIYTYTGLDRDEYPDFIRREHARLFPVTDEVVERLKAIAANSKFICRMNGEEAEQLASDIRAALAVLRETNNG